MNVVVSVFGGTDRKSSCLKENDLTLQDVSLTLQLIDMKVRGKRPISKENQIHGCIVVKHKSDFRGTKNASVSQCPYNGAGVEVSS